MAEDADYKEIAGKRIAEARNAKGYTQEELANKIPGLLPSALGNYEQGKRYPKPWVLKAMAEILGEPPGWLGGLDDDPAFIAITRTYQRLDQRGKTTLHRVAESQSAQYGQEQDNEKSA